MARVSTETAFPSIVVAGGKVTIDLADLPGLTDVLAVGAASDIRALAYAIDIKIAEALRPLAAAARPTGFTKTVGTVTVPQPGQQLIPITTSYSVKDNLLTQQLVDEV